MGLELDDTTKLVVKNKNFFKEIHGVLNNAPKEDIVNYLLFGQLRRLAGYTTRNMRNIKDTFNMIIGRPTGSSSRFAAYFLFSDFQSVILFKLKKLPLQFPSVDY